MTAKAREIVWKRGTYGAEYGYVGELRCFEIHVSVDRSYKYSLYVKLPGFKNHYPHQLHEDATKQAASILRGFTRAILEES